MSAVSRASFVWRGLSIDLTNPNVYPPKAASLLLAEIACDVIASGEFVLDVCTGSGIVGIALAKGVSGLSVAASDISEIAVMSARRNAVENDVSLDFRVGDLYSPFARESFDAIVVHPPAVPYSAEEDWGLSHGMRVATDGGWDGSDVVIRTIMESRRLLRDGGRFLLLLPHWSNYRKAHQALIHEFGAFEKLAEREIEFFPATEGMPTSDAWEHMKQLASSGVVELELSGSLPYSRASVVQAFKRS